MFKLLMELFADTFDHFRNRQLSHYPKERIIDYVNRLSSDIQKNIDESVEDLGEAEVLNLANFMSNIDDNRKPQELPLIMKLKSESDRLPSAIKTHNVNFS